MAGLRKPRHAGNSLTDAPYRIRSGAPADAPTLAAIERRCFGDPWSEASFRDALRASWSFGLVAEHADGIVGYLIAREAAGTGEILNLAVDQPWRRQGIAWALLDAGLVALQRRGTEEVYLEVRVSNDAARLLYHRAGFSPVGRRREYYRSPVEDALVLRRALDRSKNATDRVNLLD
ncbi:MAG TPA: ribosomal protein S18-alanine N-acetyltransferase [Gemmatimonadales bacterium]|nr:ribosomal protein S18-alanine N-acetyltransferase [Gemmatimonadales bacterium]